MATKGERQALMFLAAVALLGAATRVYRSRHVSVDTAGLEAQIEAVDQVRPGQKSRRPPKAKKVGSTGPAVKSGPVQLIQVDVDRASPAEIEKLPGIGPALAMRIVTERERGGPFGCLVALDTVRGIGPVLLKRLESAATFSGPGRAACVRGAGDRPPR